MSQERSGAVTFKGNPLTLIGAEIKVGSQAPDFQVLAGDLTDLLLKIGHDVGKIRLYDIRSGFHASPFISSVLFLLLEAVPRIDPFGHNIKKFRDEYDTFVVLIVAFLFYIHLLVLLINTGVKLDIFQWIAPGFAVLFYYFGILSEKSHRNWFIGFRTPWTMTSDRVWEKTNRVGAKLFKIIGIISFVGIFLPKYWILVILFSAIFSVIYLVIYSYKEWKKTPRKSKPVYSWKTK